MGARSPRTAPVLAVAAPIVALVAALIVAAACAADPPRAVVGITVAACPPEIAHGTAAMVAPGLYLTVAHVLKGGEQITLDDGDRTAPAEIVGFDPEMDLAYLRAAPSFDVGAPLVVGDGDGGNDVAEGATGVAYVFRDGAVEQIDVRVRRRINLRTEDIYIDGEYDRPAWELDAATVAGDSGGPVVVAGRVIGVLALRNNRREARAYAVDPVRGGDMIEAQLRSGELGDVDIARCY